MASFNQVAIAGNVCRDPEVKYLQSGKAVCELTVAITEKRKDGESTAFIDVVLWDRTAEVAGEYLKKGSGVLIGGKLEQQTWEKDGQKRSKLRVVGFTMQMLGQPKRGDSTSQDGRTEDEYPQAPSKPADEDVPF